MLFTIDSHEFIVKFEYDYVKPRTTTATLYVYDRNTREKDVVDQCVIRCSKKDRFEKAIGRKIAFTKLINKYWFDKVIRKNIWEQYFEQIRIKKNKYSTMSIFY